MPPLPSLCLCFLYSLITPVRSIPEAMLCTALHLLYWFFRTEIIVCLADTATRESKPLVLAFETFLNIQTVFLHLVHINYSDIFSLSLNLLNFSYIGHKFLVFFHVLKSQVLTLRGCKTIESTLTIGFLFCGFSYLW